MKTLLKVLLGLALAGAGIVAFVFWLTADLPRAADQFLGRIAAGDYDGALALTTPDFRANTDRAGLEAFARGNGLDGYRSASWSSRSIDNNVGKLEGTLTLASGAIPVTMTLVKGDAGWQVQNLSKAAAGARIDEGRAAEADAPPAVKAPDADTQRELIAGTLQALADSINGQDFSILHSHAASRFQAAASPERLAEVFDEFVQQEVDLSVLQSLQPEIEKSAVGADAILHLGGYYDTQPSRTHFDLQYEREGDAWKLIEIDVQVH